MKASDLAATAIEAQGLTHVFGVSGANIEDLFFSLKKNTVVKTVLAKTEYQAAMMALGAYLNNHKVHAVLTTSGPGVLNTLPVLAEAFCSQLPVVLIAGSIPQKLEGHGGFQDGSGKNGSLDLEKMIRPTVGFFKAVEHVNDLWPALDQAFSRAYENKIPSAVFISKNVFNQDVDTSVEKSISLVEIQTKKIIKNINSKTQYQIFGSSVNTDLKSICLKLQSDAGPPLVILGKSLIHLKDLNSVYKLIENLNASVAVAPVAKGFYNHNSPRFLGLTGIMGHQRVVDYLQNTQTVIVLGSELDHLSRYGIENDILNKNVVSIHSQISKQFVKSENQISVVGDIESILNEMNVLISESSSLSGVKTLTTEMKTNGKSDKMAIEKMQAELPPEILPEKIPTETISEANEQLKIVNDHDFTILNFKNSMHCLSKVISKEDQIFIDAGNVGAFALHDLSLNENNLCYVSLGMGGMGNSIGAAIGACCVSGKRSLVILGDGSFLMYGLEIHTAVELQLPVVFIIFNNNSHGMCVTRENVFLGEETDLNKFKQSNFAIGSEKMFPGLCGYEINNLSELTSSLKKINNISGPVVLSINLQFCEQPPFKSFYAQ